ncbi:MAG TPA: hypothetical protein VFF29_08205, partial [Bacteroidota bacterium]|nr:hypothetical protein [Bacteroidota bacterium]
GKKAKWNNSISYGGGEGRGIGVLNRTIYLSLVNEVRAYDINGTILNRFFGRSMNFILPWHITVDSEQDIYFADFFRGRIVKTTKELLDPTPQVSFPSPTTALIEAKSNQDTPFELIIENKNGTIMKHIQSTGTFIHELRVDGLLPSTTYQYKFTPTLGTIPPMKAFSRHNSFITPPVEKNGKHYSQVRMVALIFANVIDDQDSSKGIPEQPLLSNMEIDRIKGQLSDAVKFYWIHSSMNLFLNLEPIVISDRLQRNTLYGQEWWYPPKEEIIKKYLTLHEKQISDYAAILYLTCTQSYDSTFKKYVLAGKGGAFTNGVGTGKGYGISWWDVTKKNHNAGNNWLMVHEFNHQLDDIFLASGYPEYWFNHISPTIGTAGKFGEHFDANAYILQSVPKEEWFDLLYSTHRLTRDTDHDGIPDNDPHLPLDEVRLGSDTTKTDTDDDSISDFQELFFSNWLIEGWGETWGGQPLFPDLQSHDTDNDNIPDGKDILPCSPIPSSIRRGSLMIDGAIPKTEDLKFYDFHDDRINATIYAAWQDSMLSFVFELDRDVSIKLMLDANSDGWFLGRDNFLITLSSRGDSLLHSQVQIFNCTQPNRWPFMDQTLSNQIRLESSLKKIGSKNVITLNIPKNDLLGLSLTPNEQIGLLIGFLCPFDDDQNRRYLTIFEPNRFIGLHLSSD